MSAALFKAFKLLSLPILELVFLRLFLKHVLSLRLGFPGFTDNELFLPAPLGFFAFFLALENGGSPLSFLFSRKKLLLHFCFLILFLGLSAFLKMSFSTTAVVAWWGLLGLVILSAFLLFIDTKALLKNKALWSLFPSLLMVFSLVIFFKWGGALFENTIFIWAKSLKAVFSFLGIDTVKVYTFSKLVQINHPLWAIHIGRGCSGFDGILFFVGAFGIFCPLFYHHFKASTWGIFLGLGVFLFSFLNFFRIVFLFSLGLFFMQFFPKEEAIKLTLTLFHAHLGYLLYAMGAFSYFKLILFLSSCSFAARTTLPQLKSQVAPR